MEKFVINIGRQLGSGGRLIGKMIAEQLNISYFDKELINIASKESGLSKEIFEKADEKSTFNFWRDLIGEGSIFGSYMNSNYLYNESLFKIQSDIIRELADKQSCVFVGRCADYVLREHPRCMNIFISADKDLRMKLLVGKYGLASEDNALNLIAKTDKKRAQYYNYYTNKEWGMASSYHLCVDSSVLGLQKSAEYIIAFVKEKFGLE